MSLQGYTDQTCPLWDTIILGFNQGGLLTIEIDDFHDPTMWSTCCQAQLVNTRQ